MYIYKNRLKYKYILKETLKERGKYGNKKENDKFIFFAGNDKSERKKKENFGWRGLYIVINRGSEE